jgi:Flp pilus assembly protein TadD/2-polyprenyl-3-methyl-5-hydroxy-6-metoxy-1,4-benzoquinol methylase
MNRKERRAAKKTGTAPAPASPPPDPAGVLFARAIQVHQSGNLAEAQALYQQILALRPTHADAMQLLGITAHQSGQNDLAIDLIQRAIGLNDKAPHFHANLGQILRTIGRLDEAEASYRRALALQPDYLDVLMGLGVLLQGKGQAEEAAALYRRAIALKPDVAEAYNNLGNALEELGKLGEAIASYERAVALRPNDSGMLYNLAAALINAGQPLLALELARQGMRIAKTPEITALVGDCVKELRADGGDAEMRDLVARAISEPWGRPQDFAAAATLIVKGGGRYASGGSDLSEAADDALLLAMLENVTIGDRELERFLTRMRATLLQLATAMPDGQEVDAQTLRFGCALARQCFINEYVYEHSAGEGERALRLRDAIAAALQENASVAPVALAAIASYMPLDAVPGAERLLDQDWPEPIAPLLVQQLCEPAEERALAEALPSLTPVQDEVSRKVQSQYEANPYPRWVKAAPAGMATTIEAFLAKSHPNAPLRPIGKGSAIDLLVAGCGTGQHSIETAQLLAGARMLAIDLSRRSLAFAKRQSQARGLAGIEYAQADILELGSLGRSFDVIEASGVLHHLRDPFAGWRVLLSLLRPGGLMRLGFYSALARQDVVAARDFIAQHGFGDNADEIRRARQAILAAGEQAPFASITQSADFYSISACRDLLFHVQEHRLTLPEIAAFLTDNKLRLIGLDVDRPVTMRYRARFPADRGLTDIASWHQFETENPTTFRGMYQFWVQKEG